MNIDINRDTHILHVFLQYRELNCSLGSLVSKSTTKEDSVLSVPGKSAATELSILPQLVVVFDLTFCWDFCSPRILEQNPQHIWPNLLKFPSLNSLSKVRGGGCINALLQVPGATPAWVRYFSFDRIFVFGFFVIFSSWWFQPIWKILVKMGIFPK